MACSMHHSCIGVGVSAKIPPTCQKTQHRQFFVRKQHLARLRSCMDDIFDRPVQVQGPGNDLHLTGTSHKVLGPETPKIWWIKAETQAMKLGGTLAT